MSVLEVVMLEGPNEHVTVETLPPFDEETYPEVRIHVLTMLARMLRAGEIAGKEAVDEVVFHLSPPAYGARRREIDHAVRSYFDQCLWAGIEA